MEKIININFQGRVIPIEETAYNSLKQYIDSLRSHFANEESSDEILNDIENRIAELLSYRLKQGTACIVSSDLNSVIDSIGRLEDIEAAEGAENRPPESAPRQPSGAPMTKGRFARNADDKVIAGVCSGIANHMGIDPAIVRVLFVLLFGAFFWIYIILWIIVPSQSISSNVTRRLYRDADNKVIAGVCAGLAAYFHTDRWIPRLIFLLPLFIGIFATGTHLFWWHWGFGPHFFIAPFGGTLFILYVILWIALPYATSATDKLEMRGEKIDMHSIKAKTQANAGNAASSSRGQTSGFFRVIGILFKALFLFLAGVIALSLFAALIGLVFAGFATIPFSNFLLEGWGQYLLTWAGVVLFLGIPFLALATWIVRRLMGVRSHRHYLGYVFTVLWLIGLISVAALTGFLIRDFSSKSMVEEEYPVHQPTVGKLYINAGSNYGLAFNNNHVRWFANRDNGDPFQVVNKDSLRLNTVKVKVGQSADSLYHIYETKISRGETQEDAKNLAGHILFSISQQDSVINLPAGFTISSKDKFRNQQVVVTVEVPMGKGIQLNKGVNDYNWFNINIDGHRGNYYYQHDWNHHYKYRGSREYIMTPSGLKNTQTQETESESSGDNDEDD